MSYLNANIPPIYCKIRKEYLYDLKEHQGESSDCVIFGLVSISGRALLFNIMLPNGACFWRLPISAFFQKSYDRANVPDMQTNELQLWNCFSYYPSVHCFDWLAGIDGKYLGKDKKFYKGQYLFTVDWAHPETNILNTEHSEIPQEHKCAHILWHLKTAIMLRSQTTESFGMLIVTQQITIGLTTKYKILIGML